MSTFKAIRIDKADKGTTVALTQFDEAELMDGNVVVQVEWSTVNYKDGLAVTGKAPVVRRFPMIAGIDFAGTVKTSSHPDWKPGEKVICNGWGLGETHLGAYAEKARVNGDWLVRLPDEMTTRDAMAIGTAGYTAMLSVLALEKHGLTPKDGPIVVTGAAGGVGSVAISLLSKRGFQVIASTGRMSEEVYLKSLGASEVIDRAELSGAAKPLAKERWAGGIDSVGSTTFGKSAVDDQISRRHCRVRPGGWHGPAIVGRAVHFAQYLPPRDRLCNMSYRAEEARLAATSDRSERRAPCCDHTRNQTRGRHGGRCLRTCWPSAWPHRGQDPIARIRRRAPASLPSCDGAHHRFDFDTAQESSRHWFGCLLE